MAGRHPHRDGARAPGPTLAEATARLTGDWAADVAAYDCVHAHILAMADALTAGIVEQVPD